MDLSFFQFTSLPLHPSPSQHHHHHLSLDIYRCLLPGILSTIAHSLHYSQRHISKHKPDHVSSLIKTLQWLPMAPRTWATLFLCPMRLGQLSLPSISCLMDQTLWSCQIAFPSVSQNGALVLDTQSPLLWTFLVWPSPAHPLSFGLQLSSSGNLFCMFRSFPYSILYTSSLKAFVMQYYCNCCVPAYMSHWNLGFLRAITMSL